MDATEPKTVINSTLMLWCGVVIAELFIISHLMNSALVLFFGLILIFPLRAAWNWPSPPDQALPAAQPPAAK